MAETDYAFSPVPESEKRSTLSLSLMWLGYVIVIGSALVGGGLVGGLSLRDLAWVVYLGCFILAVIASLCSVIAHKTGLSFALTVKQIFGTRGAAIVELLIPIIFAGWFAVNTSLIGDMVRKQFGLSSTAEGVFMVALGLIMVTTAYFGIKALSFFSYISNIVIVVLGGAALYYGLGAFRGSYAQLLQGESQMPLTKALEVIIGSWIFGAIIVSMDLMRFSRHTKSSIISASVGLLLGTAPTILIGAVTARAINNPNPIEVLFQVGSSIWIVIGLILLVVNVWDTNDKNLYSAGLSIVNITDEFLGNFTRKHAVLVIGAIASLLTLIRPHQIGFLFLFLGMLGKIIPPLAGIIFSHYMLTRGAGAPFGYAAENRWNKPPLIAWAAGAIAAFIPELLSLAGIDVSLLQVGSVNGLIVGGLAYYLLAKRHVSIAQSDASASSAA